MIYEWERRTLPSITPRDVQIHVLPKDSALRKAYVLTGFRRVGKTYLLFDQIHKLLTTHDRTQVIYLNFEDERISRDVSMLTDLLPTLQEVYGHLPTHNFFLMKSKIFPPGPLG